MGDTVLSVSSRALLGACARLGLDTDEILKAAGLDRSTIDNPDARIPVEQASALWQKAYQLSNDPDLALHAIEALPLGAYRVIDYLISAAPTIGSALVKISDYCPLINSLFHLPYDVGDVEVTYGVEAPKRPLMITRPYAEYTLAACFLHTRRATNQPFKPLRVEFSHPPPPSTSEHERIFECPAVFGAEKSQMVIARSVWDTPRTESNPALLTALEDHAQALLQRLPNPDSLVGNVRQAINEELKGGNPKLESIARRLAMSARTLQRRLSDEGVVFNDVLDAMRFDAAKTFLSQRDIAGAEVAYLLGFADQSSFHRAFKRWSDQTPTEFRRRISIS